MFEPIKLRIAQGDPIVHDVHARNIFPLFRGRPELDASRCKENCEHCKTVCPTQAIHLNPLTINMGDCLFCGHCEKACSEEAIRFTNDQHVTCGTADQLLINTSIKEFKPAPAPGVIKKLFGRSLKLRQISAGGCNGCELELNACSNVNFDMGRYGIEFVASPRHADGVVITGPIPKAMADAVDDCYEAVPHPKLIILYGACAISGGIFKSAPGLDRRFIDTHPVDLYIPGCPPHPLTVITGLLDWLERKA
jgi:Ni,Fe-hydrogenase III small subunit/Pyruvate/2-oxoacid:ferredoxin oxidoreductase delta subunit